MFARMDDSWEWTVGPPLVTVPIRLTAALASCISEWVTAGAVSAEGISSPS